MTTLLSNPRLNERLRLRFGYWAGNQLERRRRTAPIPYPPSEPQP